MSSRYGKIELRPYFGPNLVHKMVQKGCFRPLESMIRGIEISRIQDLMVRNLEIGSRDHEMIMIRSGDPEIQHVRFHGLDPKIIDFWTPKTHEFWLPS